MTLLLLLTAILKICFNSEHVFSFLETVSDKMETENVLLCWLAGR